MGWRTDALAALDRATEAAFAWETRLADRYRERRADGEFQAKTRPTNRLTDDAPEHVVVVVVDALRADAVGDEQSGEAGHSRTDHPGTPTPFLDGLSGTTAISPSTWTFPAVASLVTGQYPHTHGSIRRTDDFADSVADVTGLPPTSDAVGVVERFARAGYDTFGGFGMLVPFLALSGRFSTHRLYDDAAADRVLADHLSWLASRRDRSTVSYLHLADLHEPVDPPAAYWEAHGVDATIPGVREWRHEAVTEATPTVERYRDHRRRLYRAGVEYVDNRLAAYHRRLSDLLEDVTLVVAGDHGEGFWERADHAARHFADSRPAYCVGHGGVPYEVSTRIPLRFSGLDAPSTFDGPVSLVDVAPTLADAAGLELDADGESLRDGVTDDRTVIVESARYGYEKKAAYSRGYKLIASRGDDYAEGFSVPGEESVELPADVETDLRDALPAFPNETGRVGDDGASRSVERRLADLGYR